MRVFGPDKVGVDAGELAGTGANTGVTATDDVDALVALEADCVLHMPSRLDVDELCRLLASGKNVVSTCAGAVHARCALSRPRWPTGSRPCARRAASRSSPPGSPGFISDVAPIAPLFLERSLDTLLIEEFADLSQRDSPKLLFEVMGMGRRPGVVDECRAEHMRASFGPPLEALAERIGVAIDRVEAETEVAVASRRVTIAAGDIEAGSSPRADDGGRGGGRRRPALVPRHLVLHRRARRRLAARHHRLAGDRRGRCAPEGRRGVPDRTRSAGATTPGSTANPAVNSVVAVCAARPGVLTSADLGVIVPRLA